MLQIREIFKKALTTFKILMIVVVVVVVVILIKIIMVIFKQHKN